MSTHILKARLFGIVLLVFMFANEIEAQDTPDLAATSTSSSEEQASPAPPLWRYGGFVDLAYELDFNHPANNLFRSRGTAFRVNELVLNMADAYISKDVTEKSRWGMQLTVQGGKDSQVFGYSATAPNLAGSTGLRHLGPTNISYLAPIGKGLTLQGGIFNSFIGYDGLYAKDNFEYTRPWGADFTPYLMLGVDASYPLTDKLTGTLFLVNGYWHLADANSTPSIGGQLAYKPTGKFTLKQTFLYGPHQAATSAEFWRFISDSILEYKASKVTTAFEFHIGSEKVAVTGNPRANFLAAQLPVHWTITPRWSLTTRPEVYWDGSGRLTGGKQTVKAFTETLEYKFPYRITNTILRLEYRFDDSRGAGGGFFRGAKDPSGAVALTPSQHLLIFGVIWTLDGSFKK